jgi:hypothetical protein
MEEEAARFISDKLETFGAYALTLLVLVVWIFYLLRAVTALTQSRDQWIATAFRLVEEKTEQSLEQTKAYADAITMLERLVRK